MMLKVKLISALLLVSSLGFSQKSFESDYYKFVSPSDFTIKRDITNDGIVDVLTVLENDSTDTPKYLIYLHKAIVGDTVNVQSILNNQTLYTSDLNCHIESANPMKFNGYNGAAFKVSFNGYENVVGYVFMTTAESTLNRILFMIQDENYYKKYLGEIEQTLNTLEVKKL